MDSADREIDALKARLIRAEAIAIGGGSVIVFLILVLFGMLISHGGAIARMHVRIPDSLPVVASPDPAPAPQGSKIEATSFVLRDAEGNARIIMGITPDNSANLVLRGTTDSTICGIATQPDGTMAMTFMDGPDPILVISGKKGGECGIMVGKDHKVGIITAPDHRGASVVVQGEGGKIIGQLP